MKIKELIAKVLSGEEMTDDELNFLRDYTEPENGNRIPKARLDQEIARKKELESKVNELSSQLEELQNSDLSETEKNRKVIENLSRRIESLSQERDRIESEKKDIQFRNQVTNTAVSHNFDDSGYLEYLLKRENLDIGDSDAVNEFMDSLKSSSPKLFKIDVNQGGAGSSFGGTADEYSEARNSKNIDRMIALAPAVS